MAVETVRVWNVSEKLPVLDTAQIGACVVGWVGVKGEVASSCWARGRRPYWWLGGWPECDGLGAGVRTSIPSVWVGTAGMTVVRVCGSCWVLVCLAMGECCGSSRWCSLCGVAPGAVAGSASRPVAALAARHLWRL